MGQVKNKIPKVLLYPSKKEDALFYRNLWPAYALEMLDKVHFNISHLTLRDKVCYKDLDVVQIQNPSDESMLPFFKKLCKFREEFGLRIVCDIDRYESFLPEVIDGCDEIVCATEYLKEMLLKEYNQNQISVIETSIPFSWAGSFYNETHLLKNYRENQHKPRVLFIGDTSHVRGRNEDSKDDFSHVVDTIKETKEEFAWVFVGAIPWELSEEVEKNEIEFYEMKSKSDFHKHILSCKCNALFAPLLNSKKNLSRSGVKVQIAGAHGLPGIFQDCTPYKRAPFRFRTGDQLITSLRSILSSEENYLNAARKSRRLVDTEWLELDDHIEKLTSVYLYPYLDPERIKGRGVCL